MHKQSKNTVSQILETEERAEEIIEKAKEKAQLITSKTTEEQKREIENFKGFLRKEKEEKLAAQKKKLKKTEEEIIAESGKKERKLGDSAEKKINDAAKDITEKLFSL